MNEQEKKVQSNQNSMIQNSEHVTPPARFEPKVKSERKNGSILEVAKQPAEESKIAAKNNETEANCTFGIINNNSVQSKAGCGNSDKRKGSLKSSQES